MALCNRFYLTKSLRISNLSFSTSTSVRAVWRKKQDLEENLQKHSPLNTLPDYSFVDGRPVPFSWRQLEKKKFQEDLCKKVVQFSHELDVGLALYHEKMEKQRIEKENILKNRLKAKGAALLKNNKKKDQS